MKIAAVRHVLWNIGITINGEMWSALVQHIRHDVAASRPALALADEAARAAATAQPDTSLVPVGPSQTLAADVLVRAEAYC